MGEYLELVGHQVDFAYHGQAALGLLDTFRFDMIVLDIQMPGMDGLTVCETIRSSVHADLPIIFVSARDTLEDRLTGFKCGCDDYLVKPVELAELHARIEALQARRQRRMSPRLQFGQLSFDNETDTVCFADTPLHLDPTQKRIVNLLLRQAPKLVSGQDIAYELWQSEACDSSALRTQIYRLRKVLPDGVLMTERGKGYRLCDV
jgi:DNA-binding response OmpR family regulator